MQDVSCSSLVAVRRLGTPHMVIIIDAGVWGHSIRFTASTQFKSVMSDGVRDRSVVVFSSALLQLKTGIPVPY